MCPACAASAAVMIGSVMSTGGVAALAVKLVRGKKSGSQNDLNSIEERSNDNGNDDNRQDGSGQSGSAG
jgi:hypothetical protein